MEVLINAVTNGGIIGHYCNYGAENNKETIGDLNGLGLQAVSEILLQVNRLFPNEIPPKDGTKRNEIIASWPEYEYDDLLETLDKQFSKRIPEMENKLIEHILSKNLSS